MPSGLTGDARVKVAEEAYEMHILRVSNRQIAKRLEVGPHLVAKLLKEESERRNTDRAPYEKPKAIATYERVIQTAFQRLARIQDNSLNVSGLFNVIVSAQRSIDDITGVKIIDTGVDATEAIENFAAGAEMYRKVVEERGGPGNG
jgi:hypothetical protein